MQDVRTWIEGLRARLLLLVVRGLVTRARYPKDSGEEGQASKGTVQLVQLEGLAGEVLSDVEHPQPYGFASRVKIGAAGDQGAECVAVSLGGDRARTIVLVAYNRKVGMKVAPGEVALFDDLGQWVRLQQNGRVTVKANDEVRVIAPRLICGNAGTIETAGTVHGGVVRDNGPLTPTMQSMRDLFNMHTHPGSGPPQQQM